MENERQVKGHLYSPIVDMKDALNALSENWNSMHVLPRNRSREIYLLTVDMKDALCHYQRTETVCVPTPLSPIKSSLNK
jgi:hypothetical protein